MNKGPSRKIYQAGEEVLTKQAETVTAEEFTTGRLTELAKELNSIAREIRAVGFSAPQLGYSKRVMTIGMEFDNPRRPNVQQFPNMTFVNPELTFASEETAEDWEGCASFTGMLALVSRPVLIRYKAQDAHGQPIEGELHNFPARVFQHELDHLNGVLMNEKTEVLKEFDLERDIIISMSP